MIFVEMKVEAGRFENQKYARFLPLHGDLSQSRREQVLERFKHEGSKHILVATDVAARGLDVDDIDVIIQMGCRHIDSFVHRAGRTARRGKEGLNILFFEPDSYRFINDIEKETKITLDIVN